MSRSNLLLAGSLAGALVLGTPGSSLAQEADTLVYADFEAMDNDRPVSSRGGLIRLVSYQESDLHKSTFKGLDGTDPPAPELVRIKKDDPNHAMKFDFVLKAPNQYAGVGVEIQGNPQQDGKTVADDVTRRPATDGASARRVAAVGNRNSVTDGGVAALAP